jgi:hypothetical protein
LRNRGCPAAAMTLQIFPNRISNLFPIETVMLEEACVLRRQDRVLKLVSVS